MKIKKIENASQKIFMREAHLELLPGIFGSLLRGGVKYFWKYRRLIL